MTGETVLTVVGNLTADPELRHTQGGLAVVNFTVASTPRVHDRASNEWKDGEPLFLRCSAWRAFAEHIAGSLKTGSRVIASGRLKQRNYVDAEGNNRTAVELEVDEIGPSLKYATATVQKVTGERPQPPQGEQWSTGEPSAPDTWDASGESGVQF